MDKNLVKTSYNKIAKTYSQTRDRFKNKKYLEKFNSLLKPHSTILDIGCGSGRPIDEFLIKKKHKIIGIDISEKQIKMAKKNFPKHKFEVRDMDELNDHDYSVDAVISFYAIFHIPRKRHQQLFNKISSFLPKDGLLLVTMGSSEWEGEENFHGAKMQWSHYGREKNIEIIKDAGFEILLNEIDSGGGEKHQVVIAKKLW